MASYFKVHVNRIKRLMIFQLNTEKQKHWRGRFEFHKMEKMKAVVTG